MRYSEHDYELHQRIVEPGPMDGLGTVLTVCRLGCGHDYAIRTLGQPGERFLFGEWVRCPQCEGRES